MNQMKQFFLFAAIFQLVFLVSKCQTMDSIYDKSELQYRSFEWEPMIELHNNTVPSQIASLRHNKSNSIHSNPFASDLLKQPLYISLTTIHSRIYGIVATIETIISGTVLPDHIYIFVSRDPHLLDAGVTPEFILLESKGKLKDIALIYPWISVIFTENIGPHRKLLPLLAKKWNEDCVIVTVDDHELYSKTTVQSLIEYYEASGRSAVVALRARRMGICSDAPPWRIAPYTKHKKGLWPEASPGHREMLLLPTGTGGVLYRPKFFHPIVFDRRLIALTKTGDDLMFRLATMIMGVPVVTACAEKDALGKPCPLKASKPSRSETLAITDFLSRSSILSENCKLKSEKKEGASAMYDFTFGHNYTDDLLKGNLVSPGVHSSTKESSDDSTSYKLEKKKTRNKSKDRNKDKKREVALALLNSASGVRIRYLEETTSNLRKETNKVEWKQDLRKKESLASIFNNVGGNNEMWDISLQYLFDTKKINFDDMLQSFVPYERSNCLMNSNVIQRKYGEGFSYMLRNGIDSIKVAMQKLYSPECGLCACTYSKNNKIYSNMNISSELFNIYNNNKNNHENNSNITSNVDNKDEDHKRDNYGYNDIIKDKLNINNSSAYSDIESTAHNPEGFFDIELNENIPVSNSKKLPDLKRISKQISNIGFNAHNYFGFISLTLVIMFMVIVKNRFIMKVISSYSLR